MPSANHAPIGTSNTVTALEDTAYVFTAANFGFTDPNDSPANNLHSVKISTTPMFGSLTNNGLIVTSGSFVSLSDINAGNLRFTAMNNANGTSYSSFSFQVKDDGGTAGGGVDVDVTPRTMTINVTAVNDAPDFTASNPPTVVEYRDPESISMWAFFTPGGGFDEMGQTATYSVSAISNPGLFAVSPAVASNGTLTYTLAPYVNGTSTFNVQAQDNLGGLSAVRSFTITAARVLAPFVVNTTADTADANIGDGRARDANGMTSLRAAIQEANATPSAQNPVPISFSFLVSSTISLTSALPDLAQRMTITGTGSNLLTITRAGGATPAFRIFNNLLNNNVSITNLRITNGNASIAGGDTGNGGGIRNIGTLSLTGVVMVDNQAGANGGAIYTQGALTLNGCSVFSNQATSHGGGIYNTNGTAWIHTNSDISTNTAATGGGIYNSGTGQVTIESGSQIYGNHAIGGGTASQYVGAGGGIANFGTLTVSDASIYYNDSLAEGGGVFTDGNATFTNVSIQDNWTTDPNGTYFARSD